MCVCMSGEFLANLVGCFKDDSDFNGFLWPIP